MNLFSGTCTYAYLYSTIFDCFIKVFHDYIKLLMVLLVPLKCQHVILEA